MKLFTPVLIGKLEMKNRIVLPPMVSGLTGQGGHVNEELIEHYRRFAAAGCGLIILEACSVNEERSLTGPGIWDYSFIPGLSELAEAIHRAGARVFVQLADSLRTVNKRPVSLNKRDIEGIREDFIAAAGRAYRAGFDGVELHCAHGFTLADFLSRLSNHRRDDYGGSVEGRCRTVVEIIKGIRGIVREELFAIGCRINGDEFITGGNTLKDARSIGRALETAGADYIHVSAGARREGGMDSYSMNRCEPAAGFEHACNIHLAEGVKMVVRVPVIGVGKIPTPAVAEWVLQRDKADMVAIGRAQIADPEWVKKARAGASSSIRRCIYCNHCLKEIRAGHPISCILDSEKDESDDEERQELMEGIEGRNRVCCTNGRSKQKRNILKQYIILLRYLFP